MSSEIAVMPPPRATVTEYIRVWAFEVPAYKREGWQLSYVRRGLPSEALLGPEYADCLMVRRVNDG